MESVVKFVAGCFLQVLCKMTAKLFDFFHVSIVQLALHLSLAQAERNTRKYALASRSKGVDLTGLLGGHKRRLGSRGRAEAFFVQLHIIFALKYNK